MDTDHAYLMSECKSVVDRANRAILMQIVVTLIIAIGLGFFGVGTYADAVRQRDEARMQRDLADKMCGPHVQSR